MEACSMTTPPASRDDGKGQRAEVQAMAATGVGAVPRAVARFDKNHW